MRMSSTLLRNPQFARQTLAMLLAVAACAVAAGASEGMRAFAWCACTGVVAVLLFAVFSQARYAEIARLSEEIDAVLHEGRHVDFSSCREGDVEVLRSELSKVVARLVRTTELLAREKRALADAMADISHQIRTPLTAISLMLPAIERADAPAERKRLARELEMLTERVSWLVTSLLKMAKVDAGALTVDQRRVRVEDAVTFAVRPLEAALDLHGVRLEVACDDDASFTGDARWSAEAIENIVKNCMEHTPAGGVIRVRASEDALATRIVIEDSGSGIAPEDLPHVFDRFFRGREARNLLENGEAARTQPEDARAAFLQPGDAGAHPAQLEGFGIGLSLAQALIGVQGGTVRAQNAAGGGACFEIAFPKLVV